MRTVGGGFVVEAATVEPWSSLTFTGERHALVVRLPPGSEMPPPDTLDLAVPRAIVAVERAEWTADSDGPRLAVELLIIAHPS